MFSIKQTRIILILTVIITFLIAFIGLNLKEEKKDTIPMKAKLEVPEIRQDLKYNDDLTDNSDVLKDEGKTIFLEE